MLAATGEDPRSRMKTSAKSSAHLPPTGRQNVLREPIPVAWSIFFFLAAASVPRLRSPSELVDALHHERVLITDECTEHDGIAHTTSAQLTPVPAGARRLKFPRRFSSTLIISSICMKSRYRPGMVCLVEKRRSGARARPEWMDDIHPRSPFKKVPLS